MSNFWILRNILCSLLGAHLNGFLAMASKGFWSLSIVTGLPYAYCSNLSSAKTTARISFSICAYLDSVSVRARLAKATGSPLCCIAALSPFSLASHWIVSSSSGCSTWEVAMLWPFLWFVCSWVYFHSFSLQVRFLIGSITSLSFGINFAK